MQHPLGLVEFEMVGGPQDGKGILVDKDDPPATIYCESFPQSLEWVSWCLRPYGRFTHRYDYFASGHYRHVP